MGADVGATTDPDDAFTKECKIVNVFSVHPFLGDVTYVPVFEHISKIQNVACIHLHRMMPLRR